MREGAVEQNYRRQEVTAVGNVERAKGVEGSKPTLINLVGAIHDKISAIIDRQHVAGLALNRLVMPRAATGADSVGDLRAGRHDEMGGARGARSRGGASRSEGRAAAAGVAGAGSERRARSG